MFHKCSTGRWANTAATMLPKLEGELTRKHSSKPFPPPDAPPNTNLHKQTPVWYQYHIWQQKQTYLIGLPEILKWPAMEWVGLSDADSSSCGQLGEHFKKRNLKKCLIQVTVPDGEKGVHECVDDEEGDDPRSEEAVVSEDGKGKRIHSLFVVRFGNLNSTLDLSMNSRPQRSYTLSDLG